jgi:tetratricopeptide (TPR) repeat protein
MRYYARLLRAPFTASLMVLTVAGGGVAGSLEDGVERDYAAVLRLFRPLADQGDDVAQFDLGVMYNKVWGVPRDYLLAAKWYRLAAAQGNADAQYNLGILYDDGHRYAEAVKWYRKAADQGLGDAQFNLGLLYAKGRGVPRDYVQAYMWFELSAAQDDQSAVSNRDAAARRMTPLVQLCFDFYMIEDVVAIQQPFGEWAVRHPVTQPAAAASVHPRTTC